MRGADPQFGFRWLQGGTGLAVVLTWLSATDWFSGGILAETAYQALGEFPVLWAFCLAPGLLFLAGSEPARRAPGPWVWTWRLLAWGGGATIFILVLVGGPPEPRGGFLDLSGFIWSVMLVAAPSFWIGAVLLLSSFHRLGWVFGTRWFFGKLVLVVLFWIIGVGMGGEGATRTRAIIGLLIGTLAPGAVALYTVQGWVKAWRAEGRAWLPTFERVEEATSPPGPSHR